MNIFVRHDRMNGHTDIGSKPVSAFQLSIRSFGLFSEKAFLLLAVYLVIHSVAAQSQTIRGTIQDGSMQQASPLVGASIFWQGTTIGTTTDANGKFVINQPPNAHALIISFVGYTNDTIHVHSPEQEILVTLKPGQTLKEVVIEDSRASSFIDPLNPIRTEKITTKELQKAACCNLSESFETNASVDVSFSDAISGTKQIQMLGLDGVYVQMQTENIPSIRGLNAIYGLNHTPGTWVSSIDVGKGAGSVVNGYESITGQINVELQKPEASERLFVNGYLNQMGRGELNIQSAQKVGKKWSTGLLLHGSALGESFMDQMDRNKDGFLDLPMFKQFNALNRWKYDGERVKGQFGIKTLYDNRRGGQLSYYDPSHEEIPMIYDPDMGHSMPDPNYQHKTPYGTGTTTRRNEVFGKLGIIFPEAPYRGLGIIVSGVDHETNAFFGTNTYKGQEQTLYANLIYQTIIGNTNHAIRMGMSYMMDKYKERYRDSSFARTESVPGIFGEYTYTIPNKFTAVAGLRTDFHNLFGTIVTPRLHLKYDVGRHTSLRASAGRGFRVANPIAENTAVLVSSRQLVVTQRLNPEKAWNYGINLSHDFRLFGRYGSLLIDLYRTEFSNQVVTDLDANPQQIRFYNLEGRSFANTAQVELNYQPVKRLDVKLAYKLYDVRTTINQQLRRRPLVSRDRALFNVAYATKKDKWKFDFTTQWIGSKRIPDTQVSPSEYQQEKNSPSYLIFNAQVTRSFKNLDWYIGGENLGNFRQSNPIIAANDPFGQYFDASLVWGPIVGRMIYTGFRFRIK
ncbi:TonB-dependent receptor [Cytophagaceae bacterium DM2B3-1]|uniref:TonB-dependent receptor n=1 Tax=Xanthocytophaga flava TaxID=3048013 RepID=A0ABT7CLX5_9BACT|nr:TonB-dependent receptor [Xanthocytophaga flavus]MDJ1494697.1 TonB-dependent receptor [Xanthocytophaga flavus]